MTNNSKRVLTTARIIVVLVAAVIFAGSSVPGKNIPHLFKFTPDKLIHCLEYAVLAVFIFRWLKLEFPAASLLRIDLLTFLVGSFMGILDENYQRFIPGRHPDVWDWVLDSIGVLLAIVTMNFIVSRNKK
jgi:VanZ family protein